MATDTKLSDAFTPPSPFEILAKQHELKDDVKKLLFDVLSNCEIVLLCDDSSSMQRPIAEEGIDAFAVKKSTRWLELKKLAAELIKFVTAINSNGLDLYFLNRPKITNVNSIVGLQTVFADLPTGTTPLWAAIKNIYRDKGNLPAGRQLLLIIVSDGEPSDCSLADLKSLFTSKPSNFHISLAECTDEEETMKYLDGWDQQITNFDNTDDYREELQRVKQVQGVNFKFDYTDYVIKILLATFSKKYFNLDQPVYAGYQARQTPQTQDDCCCVII